MKLGGRVLGTGWISLMTRTNNLFSSDKPRDFFVYIDPEDLLVRHQVGLIGSFTSMPADASAATLMFLPNPAFKTFISPFQNNLLRQYIAEYNLELSRQRYFAAYPEGYISRIFNQQDV